MQFVCVVSHGGNCPSSTRPRDRTPLEITEPCHAPVNNTHRTHTHTPTHTCRMHVKSGQTVWCVWVCLADSLPLDKSHFLSFGACLNLSCFPKTFKFVSSAHTFCFCPFSFGLSCLSHSVSFSNLTGSCPLIFGLSPKSLFVALSFFLSTITWLYLALVHKRPLPQTDCSRKCFLCDAYPAPCFADSSHIIMFWVTVNGPLRLCVFTFSVWIEN